MKIRNGFVSNSSSSSFVILLPDDFDINKVDMSIYLSDGDEASKDSVKVMYSDLIRHGYICQDDAYNEFSVLREILTNYIIAEIDGGPDDGQIVLADKEKIKQLLKIN